MATADRKALGKAGMLPEEAEAAFIAKNERQLHDQIANLLRLRRIWFCHSRTDRKTTQAKGVPDFLLALNGAAVAIEVKYGPGKLSDDQERCIAHMRACGWSVHVVRDLEAVRAILPPLDYPPARETPENSL
jgi:hypothetical protein